MTDEKLSQLEMRLKKTENELAIRNVIARYGLAADCGDIDAALSCHMPDAKYIVSAPNAGRKNHGPENSGLAGTNLEGTNLESINPESTNPESTNNDDLELNGHDAIRAMLMSEMHQSLLPNCAHTTGPLMVDVTDAHATVTGYSRVYHQQAGEPTLMRLAFNRWTMKKSDTEWKIAMRESRIIGEEKAQALLKSALAR